MGRIFLLSIQKSNSYKCATVTFWMFANALGRLNNTEKIIKRKYTKCLNVSCEYLKI